MVIIPIKENFCPLKWEILAIYACFLLSYFLYVMVAFDKHDHIDHNLLHVGWLMVLTINSPSIHAVPGKTTLFTGIVCLLHYLKWYKISIVLNNAS